MNVLKLSTVIVLGLGEDVQMLAEMIVFVKHIFLGRRREPSNIAKTKKITQ